MNTLIIENLSVSIEEKPIIKQFSLTLSSGSVHALMGPNGSGKSSLAYALAGHRRYSAISGSALLNKKNLLDLPPHKRAQEGLFIAFQYPQSLPGVNVFTFLKESHAALTGHRMDVKQFRACIEELFELMGLGNSFFDRSVNDGFSGGEKKRFEMVQLLLFKPRVAILDEIDSGLDVDALRAVGKALELVRKEHPEMILFLITHYQRILDYCIPDQVHILVDGVLQSSGDFQLAREIELKGYDGYRI
ncbi:MAG TPA: Fe-S cluster assembly ATPase SufC [Candidatus Babeliales bacterium]|nr:Fe-S cluster assembly ATPase SufC [Candidatus Babeliales bacterium]